MAPTGVLPSRGPDTWLLIVGASVSLVGLLIVGVVWHRERRRPTMAAAIAATGAGAPPRGPAFGPQPVLDDEANVPRWLRPSVRAERYAQPQPIMRRMAIVSARAPLVFREPPVAAIARMVLRYDGVALLDQPNETFASVLTELGTEDEVDILEVRDTWARVQTPDGLTGWLPTMTLRGQRAEIPPPSTPGIPHGELDRPM